MLDRLAGYIAQQIETRKMVIGASIYPGIIATMAIGVTVFLLTFVLPRFAGVFNGGFSNAGGIDRTTAVAQAVAAYPQSPPAAELVPSP